MGSTIPWTGRTWIIDWTGLFEKIVFLVPLLCQRGQGTSAMPPGSPKTESYTYLGVIVRPTKMYILHGRR